MTKQNKILFAGFLFTVVLGALNHFMYDWLGRNAVVGTFTAINESTWEHLKLLATPMLIFAVFECFFNRKSVQNFVPVRVLSIWLGMLVIVSSFYTYKGIVGKNFLAADIGTFVLGAAVAYFFSAKVLGTEALNGKAAKIYGYIGLAALIISFAVFTFFPPSIGLFAVPTPA